MTPRPPIIALQTVMQRAAQVGPGVSKEDVRTNRLRVVSGIVGRPVTTFNDLTDDEAEDAKRILIAAFQVNPTGFTFTGTPARVLPPVIEWDTNVRQMPGTIVLESERAYAVVGLAELPEGDSQLDTIRVEKKRRKSSGLPPLRLTVYGMLLGAEYNPETGAVYTVSAKQLAVPTDCTTIKIASDPAQGQSHGFS